MYASLGTALWELLWIAGRGSTLLASRVRFSDRACESFAAAAALGRGTVVVTAHTGNWDLYACAAAERFGSLLVVTKRLSVGWIDRVWQSIRAGRRVDLVAEGNAARAVLRTLRKAGTVALIADQAPERFAATTEVRFLGAPARCDLAPAMLAARAHAPIALTLGHRLADGTHVLDVPLLLIPPPRATSAWIEQATREIQAAIETFVRAHPAQWLWLHRRWKRQIEAPRRAATVRPLPEEVAP